MPKARVAAPAQSRRWRSPVGVSRSTAKARPRAAIVSGTWATKIQRQPTSSMSGPPMATPMTGPPAPTSDHQPIALTRSSRSNSLKISAIELAPVAAPSTALSVRITISAVLLHAMALRAAKMLAPARPRR